MLVTHAAYTVPHGEQVVNKVLVKHLVRVGQVLGIYCLMLM